jgi:Na+/alanine symporter
MPHLFLIYTTTIILLFSILVKLFLHCSIASIVAGVVGGLEFLYQFVDLLLAVIIIPNVIGICLMADQVKSVKDDFFSRPGFYSPSSERTTVPPGNK